MYELTGLLLAFALGAADSPAATERAISVCDLVRDAERYQKGTVTVTGWYRHGPHGATIANEQCGFESRYPPFGMGAAVDVDAYDPSEGLPSSAVKLLDQQSIRDFDEKVSRAELQSGSGSPGPMIDITVIGFINVAKDYTLRKTPSGGYEGTGYGFMGRYPVQVILLKVIASKVVSRSAPTRTKSR